MTAMFFFVFLTILCPQIVDVGNFNMKLNGRWFPQIAIFFYDFMRNFNFGIGVLHVKVKY